MPQMFKTSVKVIDKKERQRRLEVVAKASRGSYVTVGIKGADEFYPNTNTTVGYVAAVMEFGTKDGNIPSRSFIRTPVDESLPKLNKMRMRVLNDIVNEQSSIAQALETIGFFLSNRMKNAIYRGISPELAMSTRRSKRTNRADKGISATPDTPLIDSGLMVSKIGYEVYLAGGDE